MEAQQKKRDFATASSPESSDNIACKSSSNSKFENYCAEMSAQEGIQQLIYVRYRDHVLYSRSSAITMQPQTREAIGWLVYDSELYVILAWDRDAEPPTLHGGDAKASGLVVLKSDILILQELKIRPLIVRNFEFNLNCKPAKQENESAFRRPSERKTHSSKGEKTK